MGIPDCCGGLFQACGTRVIMPCELCGNGMDLAGFKNWQGINDWRWFGCYPCCNAARGGRWQPCAHSALSGVEQCP